MIFLLLCLVLGAIALSVVIVYGAGGMEAHLSKRAARPRFRNLK